MDDFETIQHLESAMLSTWPALGTVVDGTWILRLADGYTGRANSLNFLDPADGDDCGRRLDWFETVYRQVGQLPIARVTPLAPESVLAELRGRGYRRVNETMVMTGALQDLSRRRFAAGDGFEIDLKDTFDDRWLAAHAAYSDISARHREIHRQILQAVRIPRAYVLCRDSAGDIVGCLATILHRDVLSIQDVATRPDLRRRGLARAMITKAFDWGCDRGAVTGWLAVQADNVGAIRLYEDLAYRPAYNYHYLVKPD